MTFVQQLKNIRKPFLKLKTAYIEMSSRIFGGHFLLKSR
ncbi:hypothetical protein SAMD00020551_0850 [Mesobacillus selenatarsenatis SF-1]|uniref:Uncharacterized protein n=1 Tax=Mesobacillus selenatarsenatis (strain DSM 18680 / JCM 14380 / FERM P-15431 / SF-1) TaxID=1321606 RepID=A0A0A8WYC0_MESS1|nr:hypothetical protein SAMD00020551_0850 [Mesobacillus selenatarsenatis SF-1]